MTRHYRFIRYAFMTACLFLLAFFSANTLIFPEETEEAVAMISEISGSVSVKDAQEKSFKKAKENQALFEGDEVQTKKGASCELALKNDSVARLDENSHLKLTEIKTTSKGAKTSLKLFFGKVLNVVNALTGSDASYQVETPTTVAGVRGTEFAMEATEDETNVGVFSGKVGVRGFTEAGTMTEEIALTEETETLVKKHKKPDAPRKLKEKMLKWKQYLAKHRPRLLEKLKKSPELRQKLKKHLRKKMVMEHKKEAIKEKFKNMPEGEKKEKIKDKIKEWKMKEHKPFDTHLKKKRL